MSVLVVVMLVVVFVELFMHAIVMLDGRRSGRLDDGLGRGDERDESIWKVAALTLTVWTVSERVDNVWRAAHQDFFKHIVLLWCDAWMVRARPLKDTWVCLVLSERHGLHCGRLCF